MRDPQGLACREACLKKTPRRCNTGKYGSLDPIALLIGERGKTCSSNNDPIMNMAGRSRRLSLKGSNLGLQPLPVTRAGEQYQLMPFCELAIKRGDVGFA
jgi:hypothetical protein